jgi:hypothetical protein
MVKRPMGDLWALRPDGLDKPSAGVFSAHFRCVGGTRTLLNRRPCAERSH